MIDTLSIRGAYRGKTLPETTIQILCDEIDRMRGEQQTPPQGKTVGREEYIDQVIQHWSEHYGVEFSAEAGDALAKDILATSNKNQTPHGKTVNVRVAIVVSKGGGWWAQGAHDRDMQPEDMVAFFEPGDAKYWLTATLPVPAEMEVVATVEDECPMRGRIGDPACKTIGCPD